MVERTNVKNAMLKPMKYCGSVNISTKHKKVQIVVNDASVSVRFRMIFIICLYSNNLGLENAKRRGLYLLSANIEYHMCISSMNLILL
jgi:hypothetical protein